MSGDDRESLPMGRLVCLAHEWDTGSMEFDSIGGTRYRIYRDGSTAAPDP